MDNIAVNLDYMGSTAIENLNLIKQAYNGTISKKKRKDIEKIVQKGYIEIYPSWNGISNTDKNITIYFDKEDIMSGLRCRSDEDTIIASTLGEYRIAVVISYSDEMKNKYPESFQ